MPQTSGSASVDQVLVFLRMLATSQSMRTELAALKLSMAQTLTFEMVGADGMGETLTLDMTQDAKWVPTSVAKALITDGIKPVPPFPVIMLTLMPGRMWQGEAGELRNPGYQGFEYRIGAACFAESDDPVTASRKSHQVAMAFASLIRRNENLDGLVALIEVEGPVENGGAYKFQGHGLVGASRVIFNAKVFLP